MAEQQPRSAEPLAPEATGVAPWANARARLADEQYYWLATVHPEGRPHIRPVLAVWVDGAMYWSSNSNARKSKNLARNSRCAITARTDGLDLVLEGSAERVVDEATLHRVAEAFVSKYGWPAKVRDGAFDAPYGAPTAGPPPYDVYEVRPAVVFGFGTDEKLAALDTLAVLTNRPPTVAKPRCVPR